VTRRGRFDRAAIPVDRTLLESTAFSPKVSVQLIEIPYGDRSRRHRVTHELDASGSIAITHDEAHSFVLHLDGNRLRPAGHQRRFDEHEPSMANASGEVRPRCDRGGIAEPQSRIDIGDRTTDFHGQPGRLEPFGLMKVGAPDVHALEPARDAPLHDSCVGHQPTVPA